MLSSLASQFLHDIMKELTIMSVLPHDIMEDLAIHIKCMYLR